MGVWFTDTSNVLRLQEYCLCMQREREREREREQIKQIRKIQGCCCLDELEFWIPSKFQVGAVIVETWGEILGQLACETWAPGKDMYGLDLAGS